MNTVSDQYFPDLVDDRALTPSDEDLLGHTAVADELAQLTQSVPTPANIALYGAWGSGKTGLGNLLAAKLADSKTGVRFVRFDAFKYSEHPLRRHFLSQLAAGLGLGASKYKEGLYRDETKSSITLPAAQIKAITIAAVLVWLAIQLAAMVVGAAAALLSARPVGAGVANALNSTILPGAPIAALLGFLIPLLGHAFEVNRTTHMPSSEEQFEGLFRELVKDSKAKRLVILIDELDRCAPEQVVSVLETIRTFLEVPGCVFVVTADQQALEEALTQRARQATPIDPVNPYYSSGSAYLDKIFQYQLALPPVMSRRLSVFALRLVQGRGGVWAKVDCEQVVSILIPTHVASPRRVKTLLNSYVLTHNMVERSTKDGRLSINVPAQAAELAKLVCLRVEFPLFYRDLVLDPELPELVQMVASGQSRPPAISPNRWTRAWRYANGEQDLDLLMASGHQTRPGPVADAPSRLARSDRGADIRSSDRHADNSEEGGTDDNAEDDAGIEDAEGEDGTAAESAQRGESPASITSDADGLTLKERFGRLLVNYLQRTLHVGPITEELIYLESAGAAFGLKSEIAAELDRAAADGRNAEVLALVQTLDEEDKQRAVRLLVHQLKESAFGIEAANVASALLSAATEVSADAVVNSAADSIILHASKAGLRPTDLLAAYRLAVKCVEPRRSRIGNLVAEARDGIGDAGLAIALLREPDALPEHQRGRLAQAFALAVSNPETARSAVEAIMSWSQDEWRLLIHASTPVYAEIVIAKRTGDGSGDQPALEILASAFGDAFTAVVSSSKDLARSLATMALVADDLRLRNVVERHLADLAPVTDVSLAQSLIESAVRRTIQTWPAWLNCIEPDSARAAEIALAIDALAERYFKLATGSEPPDAAARAKACAAMTRVLYGRTQATPKLDDAANAALDATPLSESSVTGVAPTVEALRELADSQIVDAVFVSDLIARKVTATFRQPFAGPAIATLSQLPKYLMEWAYWSAENASCDLLTTLCSAATSCTWLASPSHEIVMLHLNSRLLRCDPATDPLSQAQVQGLVNTYGDAFDRGLQLWLEHFAQEVADVRPLLAKFVQGPISDAVAAGLVAYSTRISAADRFTLVASHLQLDAATAASDQFLAACQFRLSDQVQAAQHLLKLYEQATRNPERSTVVRYIRALAPTGNPRRDLVEVLVKMARLNKQSLETVLRNSDLLDPPPTGLRIAIREALSKGIKDRHQKEHAKQVLVSLGLIQVTPTWRGDSVRPVD